MGGRYPHLLLLLTSSGHEEGQISPVLATNNSLVQNGFNLMGTQGFVYLTEGISGHIIPTMLIFNGEVKVVERGHPLMSTHIKIGGGKQISEGVIVSSHNKRLVDEILFEVVHNSPALLLSLS